MTKLAKVNKYEGKIQATVKNLLTVGGKNIAVPVDVPINGEVGDTIRIEYDNRGFLMNSELVKKGEPEEKKPTAVEMATKIDKETEAIINQTQYQEVKKFMPDQTFVQKLITLQTCYKERMETARSAILIPDDILNEVEYERLCGIAVQGAIKDADALFKAAGEK